MKNKNQSFQITITPEHIKGAIRCDGSRCMISEAAKDSALASGRNISRVKTDLATIRFTDNKTQKRYIYALPTIARAALILFDAGKEPRPFSFKLHRPDVLQIIDKRATQSRPRIDAPIGRNVRKSGSRNTSAQRPVLLGGRPIPVAPSSNRRMFGFCGVNPALMQSMMAEAA